MSDRELQSEDRDDHNHHSGHHGSKSKVKSHHHHHCHRHRDRCRRRKAGEKHHKSQNERKRHHKSKSNSRCRSGSRSRRSSERDGDRRNRDESSSKSPRTKHRCAKHSKGHEQKDPGNRRRHYRSRSKEEDKLQILMQRNYEEQFEKMRSVDTSSQATNVLGASGTGNLSPRSKLVEQIQQRKLLFTKKTEEQQEPPKPTTGGSTLWKQPSFVDGKVSAKFKRLMGMKDDSIAPITSAASSTSSEELDTAAIKQEKYFADLEKQFEVARMTAHTQRGFGLGYGSSLSSSR